MSSVFSDISLCNSSFSFANFFSDFCIASFAVVGDNAFGDWKNRKVPIKKGYKVYIIKMIDETINNRKFINTQSIEYARFILRLNDHASIAGQFYYDSGPR